MLTFETSKLVFLKCRRSVKRSLRITLISRHYSQSIDTYSFFTGLNATELVKCDNFFLNSGLHSEYSSKITLRRSKCTRRSNTTK